jgi:hypothetical protein
VRDVVVALLFAGSPVLAQDQPAPPAEDRSKFRGGFGYSLWAADLEFEASTLEETVEIDVAALHGVTAFGTYDINARWSVRAALDFGWGPDVSAFVVCLGAMWESRLLGEPWRVPLRAALLYGTLDDEDVPGRFKGAVGVEVGVGVEYTLGTLVRGLSVGVDVAGRFLELDFDGDDEVIESDGSIGGFGAQLLFRVDYRF